MVTELLRLKIKQLQPTPTKTFMILVSSTGETKKRNRKIILIAIQCHNYWLFIDHFYMNCFHFILYCPVG